MRADRIAADLLRCLLRGTGMASEFVAPVMAFLRSGASGLPIPDVQFFMVLAPMTAAPWLPPFVPAYPDGFATRAVLLHPESRGEVGLVSADPAAAPRLVQNFLATDQDRRTLRAGLRLARELGRQPALAPFVAAEAAPGDWSDAGLDAHIAATGITAHHPVGTCRMGVDEDAVVDAELRVRGTERLRVVDASVMPDLIGGNTNAAVIMIAEKTADLIRGRAALPPATLPASA
jgi:choline dehydrogenase-like flavoprotein